jgi:hypothetical protein
VSATWANLNRRTRRINRVERVDRFLYRTSERRFTCPNARALGGGDERADALGAVDRDHTHVHVGIDTGGLEDRQGGGCEPDHFQVSDRRSSCASRRAPSGDGARTAVSKKMDGAAASAWSASMRVPSAAATPLIFGGTTANRAPAFSAATRIRSTSIRSLLLDTSVPIVRPTSVRLLHKAQRRRRLEIDRLACRLNACRLPFHPQRLRDALVQLRFDDGRQVAERAPTNRDHPDLAQLEREGADNVALLRVGHGPPEQTGLAVVIREALRSHPHFPAAVLRWKRREAHPRVLARAVWREAVGLVRDASFRDLHPHDRVPLEVLHRATRPIDGNLVEVGPAPAAELLAAAWWDSYC